jgi:hypothetical protein
MDLGMHGDHMTEATKTIDTHSFIESTRTFMPQHTDLYDIDTSDSIQS